MTPPERYDLTLILKDGEGNSTRFTLKECSRERLFANALTQPIVDIHESSVLGREVPANPFGENEPT